MWILWKWKEAEAACNKSSSNIIIIILCKTHTLQKVSIYDQFMDEWEHIFSIILYFMEWNVWNEWSE